MMKYKVLLLVAVMGLLSCQQQKIGFIDNSKVVNDYQEKKDIEEMLQAKITAFQKRADSLQQSFDLEIKAAELKSKKMSQKDIQSLSQELQQKRQLIAQRLQFEQDQLTKESQAKTDSVIKKIKDFVKDYGVSNGYSFILGSNEAGSVLYGKEQQELTQIILDKLNENYKK